MKRFGKLITLVLVVAMALSLMSVAALAASSSDYKDVVAGKWYVKYVDWALENEFMTGISDTEWAPNTATTRGMVIQTLYKMAGAPEVEGDSPFADVAEGKYYTNAVKWAVKAGVASGKSTDSFKPDDVLTRQEAATFFCAFAKNVWELDVADVSGMNKFPDKDDVANYAKDAMGWAVKANVISGSKENDEVLLMPKRDITRAELAAMLKALKELEPKKDDPTPAPVAYETADVVINLTSEDENENLSEVVFTLVGTDKNGVDVWTRGKTNKQGKLVFKDVVVSGDEPYILREENFNAEKYDVDGYDYNELEVKIAGPETVININHEFKQETLFVAVKSEDVDSTLEGVKVQISGKSASGKEVSKWTTTNRIGMAKFNVPASDKAGYKVEVVEVADYYVAPEAATVVVTNRHALKETDPDFGKPFYAELKIALKKSQFTVQLVDEKDNAIDLAGVKMTLVGYLASGTEAPRMSEVTVKGGTAVFASVPYSNADGYVLTPVGKDLLKDYEYDSVKVVADKANLGVIKVVLKKITKGVLEINKVDEKGNPIEGAEFTLTTPAGDKIVKTTDENGYVAFKDLEEAKKEVYKLEETKAPAGYVAADAKDLKVPEIKNKTVQTLKVVDNYETEKVHFTVVAKDKNGKETKVQGVQVLLKGAPRYGWPEDGNKEVLYRSSKSDEEGNIWFDEDEVRTSNELAGYGIDVINVPEGLKVVSGTAPLKVVKGEANERTIVLESEVVTYKVKVVAADTKLGLRDVVVKVKGKELLSGEEMDSATYTTDKDGKVTITEYAPDAKGYTFTIEDKDYEAEKIVKTEKNGEVEVVFEAKLKASKTDETNIQPENVG